MYAHLSSCFAGTFSVQQGHGLGNSGKTGVATNIHLHFQINTSTISTTSKAFSMSGISGWNNGGADCPAGGCPLYTSDNLRAGFSNPPITIDTPIFNRYVAAGGWPVVGSTASIPGWSPGRYSGGPCGPSGIAGWYSCTTNGRSGRVQTFKGWGSGNGEHAILDGSAQPAVFMSRGALGGFTDAWDGANHDGLWYSGYPLGASYPVPGTNNQVYRMDFQNGFLNYFLSTHPTYPCGADFWVWDPGGEYVVRHSTQSYCD